MLPVFGMVVVVVVVTGFVVVVVDVPGIVVVVVDVTGIVVVVVKGIPSPTNKLRPLTVTEIVPDEDTV